MVEATVAGCIPFLFLIFLSPFGSQTYVLCGGWHMIWDPHGTSPTADFSVNFESKCLSRIFSLFFFCCLNSLPLQPWFAWMLRSKSNMSHKKEKKKPPKSKRIEKERQRVSVLFAVRTKRTHSNPNIVSILMFIWIKPKHIFTKYPNPYRNDSNTLIIYIFPISEWMMLMMMIWWRVPILATQ